MVSLETVQATSRCTDQPSSPRFSFSAEFLDESNFISICPKREYGKDGEIMEREKARNAEFEFLSSNMSGHTMLTADELFFDGKLLPFWQMHHLEKLNKLNLKSEDSNGDQEEEEVNKEAGPRVSWFVDDDPSPRPPKCTVLWKELLRLKKQRASSLSPSSSSSSPSASSCSLADIAATEVGKGSANREMHVKRIKKGLERTKSASIRIRPMINVPICTQVKSSTALPPLFPLKKGRIER